MKPIGLAILSLALVFLGACTGSSTERQEDVIGVDSANGSDSDVTTDVSSTGDQQQQYPDVTISEELPPLPTGCLLSKEKVASLPGYSYAAGIVLDPSGAVWLAYSHNAGGYHGFLAKRDDTGWTRYDDVFVMTRTLLTAQDDGELTVLSDNGAYLAQLWRPGESGWLPTVISPASEHRTLLSAIYLGGTRYLGFYTTDGGPRIGDTNAVDPPTTSYGTIPAHLNVLGGIFATTPDNSRIALFVQATPTGGTPGLYRYEGTTLSLVDAKLGLQIAPLLDADATHGDWLLAVRYEATNTLLLRRGSDDEPLETSETEPSCRPDPYVIGSSCEVPFKSLSSVLLAMRGETSHTFVYATEVSHFRNDVVEAVLGCDPVDPSGPPPHCDGPPTDQTSIRVQRSTLTLLRAPADGSALTKKALWTAGLSLQHLRAVRDAQNITHLLVIGTPIAEDSTPTSGGLSGSLVYYLRLDVEACFQ